MESPTTPLNAQEHCNQKVAAFCAIARPKHFLQSLTECQAIVVESLIGADHVPFSQEQLQRFSRAAEAKGADYLICTEKDAVKLPLNLELELPVKILKMKIEVTAGEGSWQELLKKIRKLI